MLLENFSGTICYLSLVPYVDPTILINLISYLSRDIKSAQEHAVCSKMLMLNLQISILKFLYFVRALLKHKNCLYCSVQTCASRAQARIISSYFIVINFTSFFSNLTLMLFYTGSKWSSKIKCH